MKNVGLLIPLFVAILIGISLAFAALDNTSPPSVEITNGVVQAVLYLPNTDIGYYRGSRFDWSGVISRLEYKHHNYFGVWFPYYDPRLHDAITGPVEEFRNGTTTLGSALGYDEAPANGFFVKIGVGALKKPDLQPYSFARPYEIVNSGVWVCRPGNNSVSFEQDLKDDSGYGYSYQKQVSLRYGKAEMILEHRLKNTGRKVINTDVYDHDFYVLDGQPTGPAAHVVFHFKPVIANEPTWPNVSNLEGKALIRANELDYTRVLGDHESASALLTGFSGSPLDNDIRVENSKADIGVEEIGDQPLVRLNFWSIRTTICPEAYIHLHVEPGREVRWKIRYLFYELKPSN